MSMERTVYLIWGYDLTNYKEQILQDDYMDRYEDLICGGRDDNVRLFTDPADDLHLYLGIPLAEVGEREDIEKIFTKKEICELYYDQEYGCDGITDSLSTLLCNIFDDEDIDGGLPEQHLIMFTEWC